MSSRAAAWLACSLASLSVAMFVVTVVLSFLTRSVLPPASWGTGGLSGILIFGVAFLAFPLVGALIASRRPHNPLGWICLAAGTIWMFASLASAYGVYGLLARPGSVPFPAAIGSLGEWMWAPALGLVGTYLILLFPDGRLPSRRWRPLAWLSGAVIVSVSLGFALTPGRLPALGGVRNPFGLEAHSWIAYGGYAFPLLPVCILASALSLVLRYRRSRGEERQQIKWIAFAASVVGVMYLIAMVSAFIFPSRAWFAAGSPLWLDLLAYAALLSFTGLPIAVGLAVLRYRLYNIDLLINRTLVYGLLTASLAAVYFGGVAMTQTLFRALTGQEEQPQLAIVVSTLVIAALFNPLRRGIQSFIDRRFYRRKYDARQTLEAFSARLRNETDLDTLSGDLVGVVRETMQPAHVSLWLRSDTAPKGEQAG